jgi:NADH dehydrogenase
MLAALDDPDAHGKRYELCGPREYTLKELVELACRLTGRQRLVVGMPDFASYLQARLFELMPEPLKLMTRDNYDSMRVPNVCTSGAPLPFGLVPQSIESVAAVYLARSAPRELELLRRARR